MKAPRLLVERQHGAHTAHECAVHLVWCPRRRRPVLTGPVAAAARDVLTAIARQQSCTLLEISVQPDHVHLLVQFPPTVSLSALVNALKGASAHALRTEFPHLRAILPDSLWQDGYYAATVSPAAGARHVAEYLRQQSQAE